jgi:hypothetical protein
VSSEWLPACHGFRVEVAGRRVGIVEDVLYGDTRDPTALLVRGGLLGMRTLIVPVEAVVGVLPRVKRVLISNAELASRTS